MREAAIDPRDVLCLSHLRWSFVWQRPQQLLSRMGRHRRVFFVEEPLFRPAAKAAARVALLEEERQDGVVVCRPVCRDPGPGGGQALDAMYGRLLRDLVGRHGIRDFVLWVYAPMLLPAAAQLSPSLLVYDCMDELSLFRGAPRELVERERQLIALADLVFTGGISLYRAKRKLHSNTHCFPSGVDTRHYARATNPDTTVPADLAAVPAPRIGFFGVIDERADLELLREAAAARPDWSYALIGPVAKIDPAELPQAPNLHYLGPQPYAKLPGYLKGFDVAIMPFARNDATRFISPTKTLEYMAAHKPIVSTSVRDVAEFYRELVWLADTPEAFVQAIEAALAETPAARARRIEREAEVLTHSSWDSIVGRMEVLLARQAHRLPAGPAMEQPVHAGVDMATTVPVPVAAAGTDEGAGRRPGSRR